ncbi:MAG: lysostaphin resistance A-like protein, partial [Sarcina sp.]
ITFIFSLNLTSNILTNLLIFSTSLLLGLFSLSIIIKLISTECPDINYTANSKLSDYLCILIIILGLRLIYEGSIYQTKHLLTIDLKLSGILQSFIYAPLIEELMYRGIILNSLIKKYPEKIALILTSLLFGIMHFNFYQTINAFLVGLMIGYLYIKTKSLYLCITIHFFNNFIALYLPSFIYENILTQLIYSVINIIIGFILFTSGLKIMKLKKREKLFTTDNDEFNFFT